MKIGFIGAGAMAEAMLSGIIKNNIAASQDIFLSDHKQSRCQYLIDTYGVQASVGAAGFISCCLHGIHQGTTHPLLF